MVQDTSLIKNKIVNLLEKEGPSLPVKIAREIESSSLFTSAFLSELLSEKRIKMSIMKIGNSRLYFILGQESMLERFSQHLNSKEKEAFSLLKEKRFLKDSEQQPSIRVALRAIKDFAKPFRDSRTEEIIWRYFEINENDFEIKKKEEKSKKILEGKKEPVLGIFDKEEKIKRPKEKKKVSRKKSSSKKDEKFFNQIKDFIRQNSLELKDIVGVGKNEFTLLVKKDGKEKILVAYNKPRINEADISKANKKAAEFQLPYIVLSKQGSLKKLSNLIENLKNLDSMGSLN